MVTYHSGLEVGVLWRCVEGAVMTEVHGGGRIVVWRVGGMLEVHGRCFHGGFVEVFRHG